MYRALSHRGAPCTSLMRGALCTSLMRHVRTIVRTTPQPSFRVMRNQAAVGEAMARVRPHSTKATSAINTMFIGMTIISPRIA